MSLSLTELSNLADELIEQMRNFDVADHFSKDEFEKVMNDNYPLVSIGIGNMRYEPGTALRRIDPAMFDEEYHIFCNGFDKTHFDAYNTLQKNLNYVRAQIEQVLTED